MITDAQKKAGNYKKIHARIIGLPIAIETPKGQYRSGVDKNGKEWKFKMPFDYGYIKQTRGNDGDHLDVILGPNLSSELIFVVNQKNPNNDRFDEHKILFGFDSKDSAVKGYHKCYTKNWKGFHSIEAMTIPQFKHWLKVGAKTRPTKIQTIKYKSEIRYYRIAKSLIMALDRLEKSNIIP